MYDSPPIIGHNLINVDVFYSLGLYPHFMPLYGCHAPTFRRVHWLPSAALGMDESGCNHGKLMAVSEAVTPGSE